MSIVAPHCLANSANSGIELAIVLLVLTLFSIGAAIVARVLSPRKASGPLRVPPGRPAWPLTVVLFGAMSVYILSGALIFSLARGPMSATQPATLPTSASLAVTALASTVPPLLGLIALLLGDAAVRDLTGQDLGLDPRRLPWGLAAGLLGVIIVVPPLFLLADATEAVYRLIHYAHEAEHPLLKVLGERPAPWVTALIVIGATIIAPLFEELLFRGHIQTLLVRLFSRLGATSLVVPPSAGFPVIISGDSSPPMDAAPQPEPRPRAWQTWAAILITSALFALVHPAWTAPIIFVLAVCLGYAYERTRNLWVSITIHAMFNSISTALFLAGLGGR